MDLTDILKRNHLSRTAPRIEILEILSLKDNAISEKELEHLMKGSCNRTTIYRNLNSLVEKKLVHRILSSDSVKYRLAEVNIEKRGTGDHLHFECRQCNTTFCLEEIAVQDYSLPEGFTRQENQFIIFGICKNCCNESRQA